MNDQTAPDKGNKDKEFFIFVDGEKFDPPSHEMTASDIITKATGLDPTHHYLLRTNRGEESYKDRGAETITLQKADRFQVVFTGSTPVS
jgi:hypothetical protein